MTDFLFRDDAYAASTEATVIESSEAGVILDRSVFYPRAGGQPGDTGTLAWEGGEMAVADTVKSPDGSPLHLPAPGAPVTQTLPAPAAAPRRSRAAMLARSTWSTTAS